MKENIGKNGDLEDFLTDLTMESGRREDRDGKSLFERRQEANDKQLAEAKTRRSPEDLLG